MNKIENLEGKTFMTSATCMSVWADGLSWANAHKDKVTLNPEEANNMVVLSCQVTDLAILNDIQTLERYNEKHPGKRYFTSGCLAKREDVDLPKFIERLELPRESYQPIFDRTLINYEKPFWVPDFNEQDSELAEGHLLREMYPLRIGKGCPNKCTYCTIRKTRGSFEKYDAEKLEKEFLTFKDVLLVADNPLEYQIKDWIAIAERNNKGFSIRNVEPLTTIKCKDELLSFADKGLLKVFHSPIQSQDPEILRDMGRNVKSTFETMEIAKSLKQKGVTIATNIIIDYKDFKQDFSQVYELYNYVSWNPLWDNKWDRQRAEDRFRKYIESGEEPLEVREAKLRK